MTRLGHDKVALTGNMTKIETSVQIAAPAELVFAFFVPQRMAYWYGADMEACLEVQGGASDFAVAQKVRVTGHLGKREVSHTAVVTALQQARLFEWRFEDRYGVKGKERWELERADGTPSRRQRQKRLCECAANTRCPACSARPWIGW